MRTTRSSSRPGGGPPSRGGLPARRGLPAGEGGTSFMGDGGPPSGGAPSKGETCWETPPVDRITNACENITLPQLRCGR